jgi:heterodisulfide reductase subunit D
LADSGLSAVLAQKKIEEIQRTGAKTVVTSCQQCIRTIRARAARQEIDLDVWDITELVLKAMSND